MERGNNLNLPSFTARRLIGWLSVALFFLVDLFARLSVDVIEENLMEDFQVDATIASSVFGSSVFFSYAVMQIPHGWLLDNLGAKKTISISCFVTFVGCILFSFSHHIWLALIGRILTGAGAGSAWLGIVKVTTLNFKHVNGLPETFIGIANAIGLVGGLLAQTPFKLVCNIYGWRKSYYFFSIIPLLLTFLIYCFVDDISYEEEQKKNKLILLLDESNDIDSGLKKLRTTQENIDRHINNNYYILSNDESTTPSNTIITTTNNNNYGDNNNDDDNHNNNNNIKLSFCKLLCERNIYIFGIYLAGCDAPFETIAGLWGATYMNNIQGFSSFQSGIAISFLVIISGGTGLAYGKLLKGDTKMKEKIQLCIFAAVASFIGCLILNSCIKLPVYVVYIALFLIGQACGGMTGLWCIVPQSKLTLHGNLGLVSGIVNTICITFDSLAQLIFGVLLDYYWSGKYIKDNGSVTKHSKHSHSSSSSSSSTDEKTRYYDQHSFIPAMSFLSFFFLLGGICFYFYKKEKR